MFPSEREADSLFRWIAYKIRFKNFFLDSFNNGIPRCCLNGICDWHHNEFSMQNSSTSSLPIKLADDWKIVGFEKLIKKRKSIMQFSKWRDFEFSNCVGIKHISQRMENWTVRTIIDGRCRICSTDIISFGWAWFSPKAISSKRWKQMNFNSIKFSARDQRAGRNSSWKCQKHYFRWFRRRTKKCFRS